MSQNDYDLQRAIENLSTAISFKTISYPEVEKVDFKTYDDFLAFLAKSYPKLHKECPPKMINDYSPVFHWQGEDKKLDPLLLIGHYDVVPVEEGTLDEWEEEPFAGIIKDGYIWGRGTLDNKNQVIAALEAVEFLITEGYKPKRDIYLAFGFDEEVGGNKGAAVISQYFEDKGLKFEAVVDEGGAIIDDMMEGLDKATALVGLAEKGTTNLRISVKGQGGHSSMPPAQTAVESLAKVVDNINRNPMPSRLIPPVEEMLKALAPHMKGQGFVLKNIKTFFPIAKKILEKNPVTNALIRTTIAFTMTGGGSAANVLPQSAWATTNLRILQGDSVASSIEHIRKVNPEYDLEIEKIITTEPTPISDMDSKAYSILEETIEEIFPDVLIVPYLMAGGTDARKYYNVSNNIYRFMPVKISQEDFDSIHSTNEKISFENLSNMIDFYIKLIKKF